AVERTLRRRETANVGILTIEPPSQGQIESIVSLNRTLETLRANLIVQRTERTAQAGIQDAVIDNLQDASASLANGRLKAFRSYHLLTSFNHIISNEIKASSKNLPNAIQVGYYDLAPSLGTF
ncbi:hypothetical protein LRR18_17080, partial [Mangrovimonas sp. AS39]|uniref:hypothetical protein n=1 Tax=Mangrovimonas futianensis TaxID=2895523 RepID=UPI001E589A97